MRWSEVNNVGIVTSSARLLLTFWHYRRVIYFQAVDHRGSLKHGKCKLWEKREYWTLTTVIRKNRLSTSFITDHLNYLLDCTSRLSHTFCCILFVSFWGSEFLDSRILKVLVNPDIFYTSPLVNSRSWEMRMNWWGKF